ncbi:MAG: CehA/McbA family metallohydrolase [Dehalococcoidia bacterium]
MRHKIRLEGYVTPEHQRSEYVYLPFEMPAGARRLEVSYFYENQVTGAQETHPGNNLDIGIFDTRGADFLTGGFRGWSGGARTGFHIEPRGATPGYLRGPLQRGDWTIIFGCSKVEDPIVRYRVNVDVDVDPDGLDEPLPELHRPGAKLVAAARGGADGTDAARGGGRWYRGDLHAHSEHSDGANTVREIVEYTRRAGLDYFALTDHNTISHWDDLAELNTGAPLLIPGEEITMYGGHANVWGIDGWIDFRGTDEERVRRLIEDANARGSMFSINHPDSPIPWTHPGVRNYQAVEVWNAPWRWFNEPALERWDGHLRRGERMVAVGGSDSHCVPPAKMTQPNGPGEPCSWVYVEGALTQRAVLGGVARGHVFISEAPTGPYADFRADADGDGAFEVLPGDVIDGAGDRVVRFSITYRGPEGKHLRFFSKRGLVHEIPSVAEEFDGQFEQRLEGDDYLRLEVRGFRGRPERGEVVHAMTNPIYWGKW